LTFSEEVVRSERHCRRLFGRRWGVCFKRTQAMGARHPGTEHQRSPGLDSQRVSCMRSPAWGLRTSDPRQNL